MKPLYLVKTTLLSLVLLSLFPLNAQIVKQSNTNTTQPRNPNATFEDYKKECIAQVKGNPALRDFADELCSCTMAEYRKKYSIEEFRALVRKSETDTTARQTLEAVGEDCAADLIFE